jgi:hypothetical protein
MASKRKMQYRTITFTELAKAAHSNKGAWDALGRYFELRKAGIQNPEIRYSEFNGYNVRDP